MLITLSSLHLHDLKTHGWDKLHPGKGVCSHGPHRSSGAEDVPLSGIFIHLPLHSYRQPRFDPGH